MKKNKKVIIVVTNMWVFLEEYQATSGKIDALCLSEDYHINSSDESKRQLKDAISKIVPCAEWIDEADINKIHISEAVIPSGLPLYGRGFYKNPLKNCENYVFVEEGTYDYMGAKPEYLQKERKKALYYCFDPDSTIHNECYQEVLPLDIKKSVKIILDTFNDKSLNQDKNTPIFYTTPDDGEQVRDINGFLAGYDKIIVSQHPRDSRKLVGNNIIVKPTIIPGQILEYLYPESKKIFEQKETATINLESSRLTSVKTV